MAAGRRCASCPRIIPAGSYRGRCRDCLRRWDADRGTPTQRGYGSSVWPTPLGTMTYAQAKRAYARRMAAGQAYACACGCGRTVDPADWHLGHDDERTCIVGPMTSGCNLSAAGRASATNRPAAR